MGSGNFQGNHLQIRGWKDREREGAQKQRGEAPRKEERQKE